MALFVELNNKIKMPLIGLGTFQVRNEQAYESTLWALKNGYKMIDTASVYRNEEQVGKAIRDSGIPRSDLFIVSKSGPSEHGYNNAIQACNKSLQKLGLNSYLDLYLIHWPGVQGQLRESEVNSKTRKETWRAFEDLYKQGKCKAIGVSNFGINHLTDLLSNCQVVPAVNQVEFHPFLQQKQLLKYCKENNIQLEAYSSLGCGSSELVKHELVMEISNKYNKSSGQVLLKWALQQNIPVIPKSTNKDRIIENLNVFDFELSKEDIEKIETLEKNYHFCWNPTDVS